jgi:hypothetical protein
MPPAIEVIGERAFCREQFRTAAAGLHWVLVWLLMVYIGISSGCSQSMTRHSSAAPKRDINAVLAEHVKEFMAIPGVAGVYVGLAPDQKTPCLKVMIARKDSDVARRIPKQLEGYRVMTEVTGEIKPMK